MSAQADAFMGIFGMKRVKQKKCKHCKALFTPSKPIQTACSIACAVAMARKKRENVEKAADRQKREALKSRSQWLKEAQIAWNSYVRWRDYGKPCASCGSMPERKFGGTMDCSHYRSVGAAPHLRFNLHNAAAACVKCNRYLGGNIAALRVGLIERIGLEKVEAVEADNNVRKFDIEYLKRVKRIFTKKANRVELRFSVR